METKLKQRNLKSNNQGITLIALVVTIIVLLILASVSITMLTGENGIIKQAIKAKEQAEKSNDLESLRLALNMFELNEIKNKNSSIKEFLEDESKSRNKRTEIIRRKYK